MGWFSRLKRHLSNKTVNAGAKALILNQEGKYLFIYNKYGSREFVWTLPGGHSEWGESLEQTLARELKEEIGMEVQIIQPLGGWPAVMPSGSQTMYSVFLCAPLGEVRIKNDQPDEDIREYRWVSKEEAIGLASMNGLKEFLQKAL